MGNSAMRRSFSILFSIGAVVLLACSGPASTGVQVENPDPRLLALPPSCGIANPVFCDGFDAPAGTGNRSGQLNGTLWGVSRELGDNNLGQGQYNATAPTHIQNCDGSTPVVLPPADVIVCNGQVREATNDRGGTNSEGGVTSLAMYPKQPFDFAGRTGVVTFDVSNDNPGIHTTWPEFWLTDQPVPVPFTHFGSWIAVPRNGFGLRFAGGCAGSGNWTVDSAVVVRNYVIDGSKGPGEPPAAGAVTVTQLGCVSGPSTMAGPLNHVEVRVSQNTIDVYATDAGTTAPLKHIAVINNANLSFTRGLIWLEDVHYNAHKFGGQAEHTFAWDNVGFDGPSVPRDLTFDVPDASSKPFYDKTATNLGWLESANEVKPQTVAGVTNVENAAAALLTFNFYQPDQAPTVLNYAVNGHAHSTVWPYPDITAPQGGTLRTLALPVPLADVVNGTNTISVSSSQTMIYSNMDLVLAGAGGGVVGSPTPVPTAVQTPAPTTAPTPVPSDTPVPQATSTTEAYTCAIVALFNSTPTTYSRPPSFCTNQ